MKMFTNGTDFVICHNVEEARSIVAKIVYNPAVVRTSDDPEVWGYYEQKNWQTGEITKYNLTYDDLDGSDGKWRILEGDFTLHTEEGDYIKKTVEEWIADYGSGYVASTEY